MALACDIIESHTVRGMKLRQWVSIWVCLWMAELGTVGAAPRRDGTKASTPGADIRLFVDRPDFFDYPDSDQASLFAVAQFIGEKPVTFVETGPGPGLFRHILVSALAVAFSLFLFQFCTHVSFQKGA
ncbi:fertilization-influencing membrane protein [Mesocricetus auratus]|uniref:Fertilization-influencing membrane protein n=1 Tax=Mesocricetus auratus TaxID=10036 RepID=A0ABM2Y5V8_MESAU|nr:fertilization-influencing membrane protein [Mesocricetus auratus]